MFDDFCARNTNTMTDLGYHYEVIELRRDTIS